MKVYLSIRLKIEDYYDISGLPTDRLRALQYIGYSIVGIVQGENPTMLLQLAKEEHDTAMKHVRKKVIKKYGIKEQVAEIIQPINSDKIAEPLVIYRLPTEEEILQSSPLI